MSTISTMNDPSLPIKLKTTYLSDNGLQHYFLLISILVYNKRMNLDRFKKRNPISVNLILLDFSIHCDFPIVQY